MGIREAEVAQVLTIFLERHSPPTNMRNNKQAQQDEAEHLLDVLLRYAPQEGAGSWTKLVLKAVAENAKTRAWPIVREVEQVAKAMRPNRHPATSRKQTVDDIQINARRINNGEAVGDRWLFGDRAKNLVESGLVTMERIEQLRSALYEHCASVYGKERALKLRNEWFA
ncbi:hypothetical protein [Celeribacter halophilus]|uniref:hypothetical protein n=1 Tax=Celeribacter halophilus TaxID=576117 RepID=UPI003A8FDEFB